MGVDENRLYLRPYLINLALLVRDAKKSYQNVINETSSINFLRNTHPKSFENPNDEFGTYDKALKNHQSVRRIALQSFASTCGVISNILWPSIPISKDIKHGLGITKLDKRKKERRDHLKDLFPQICFPHLDKNFRNFLIHADERLDHYSIHNKQPNIAFNTEYILLGGSVTCWINIHPYTHVITYYDKGRYQKVDMKNMYLDILKLPPLIPKALDSIMGAKIDWHYQMVRSIIEEQ